MKTRPAILGGAWRGGRGAQGVHEGVFSPARVVGVVRSSDVETCQLTCERNVFRLVSSTITSFARAHCCASEREPRGRHQRGALGALANVPKP